MAGRSATSGRREFPSASDDSVEKFFQALVVALQAAQDDVVIIGQGEEGSGLPSSRNGDPDLAASIVREHVGPFKAQRIEKALRVALKLQSVTIMPAGAKFAHATLTAHLAA